MPFEVFLNERVGIVHIVFSGTPVKEEHYAALDAAMKLCDGEKTSKLMVDLSGLASSKISTLDVFEFGKSVAEIEQNIYIAHVLPKHLKSREKIIFVSNVEANRGKVTGEFENIDDAIAWLCKMG